MWEQKTKKPLHLIASTSDRKKDMSISLDQQKYAESLNTILLNQEQLLDNHQ